MTISWIRAKDLKPNDLLDLAGDKFADPSNDRPEFNTDWQQVEQVMVVAESCHLIAVLKVKTPDGEIIELKIPADHTLKVRKETHFATEKPKPEKLRILDDFFDHIERVEEELRQEEEDFDTAPAGE